MSDETFVSCDNGVAAAIEAGKRIAGATVLDIGGIPHVSVPESVTLESLENLLPAPTRIKAGRHFEEPDSFIAYVGEFKTGAARIYGDIDSFRFTACLDDHAPGGAGWCEHNAVLALKPSPEWSDWLAIAHGGAGNQQKLAEFFEEHMEQIAEPDASELISGVRSLSISNNWKCTSLQQEGGDINFSFQNETQTQSKNGSLPTRLTLLVAPFRSWRPLTAGVRLVFRLSEQKLAFTMTIMQEKRLVEKSFQDVRRHIEEKLGTPVLL